MDKLKMQTANKADENFKKLAEMFPNAVTETIDENGEVVRAIDKDVLMQEINTKVIDGKEERYQFTWPDKKKSVLLANAPINKTLRPCREESVDFDTTENLYIEGDNLEVLKLLEETYLHKVDIIYIDPPYNTGNNLIYKNDFSQTQRSFSDENGDYDEHGNRLVKNLETDGRFHTNWLNMIYQRLKLAKNFLKENGVLICTIDQSEVNTLGVVLKEVFSNKSVVQVSIIHNPSGTQGNNFAFNNEFAFFVFDDSIRSIALEKRNNENADIRPFMNGAKGDTTNYLRGSGAKTFYPIIVKNGSIIGFGDVSDDSYHPQSSNILQPDGSIYVYPVDNEGVERKWLFERGTVESIKQELHLKYSNDKKAYEVIRIKDEINYKTVWIDGKYNAKTHGTLLVKSLMGATVFSNPKSLYAVEECIKAVVHNKEDAIIMDFFSGSSTTAHAVMDLNKADNGKRKFIMVQLPEDLDDNLSSASQIEKATIKNAIKLCDQLKKPHTIAEVAKERIRRAGQKIRNEQLGIRNDADNSSLLTPNSSLDIGFRVLKCDTSNMKEVYYNPAEYEASLFPSLEDNIKEDRTPEDLLFQVMLDLGILLSSKIQVRSVEVGMRSYSYFDVEDGYLIACFDKNIDEEVITAIAKQKPYYFVMRDSSMASDSVATNFDQIFATYSPDTVRKVL